MSGGTGRASGRVDSVADGKPPSLRRRVRLRQNRSATLLPAVGSSVGTHADEVSMEVQYCCVLSRQLTVRPGRVRFDEFNRDPLTCCSPRALVSSLLGLPEVRFRAGIWLGFG